MTRRQVIQTGLVLLVAAGTFRSVQAQRPPGGGPPGGGPSPEMRQQFEKWRKWQDSHKNLSALQGLLFQIRNLDREAGTKLSKQQAGKLLTIYKGWQSKPTMTEAQAKALTQQIRGILTPAQIKQLSAMRPPFGGGPGRPGGGPPGGMRPGGPRPDGMRPGGDGPRPGRRPGGPPGGMRPGQGGPPGGGFRMPEPPKGGYNPLNPNTLPFTQMRAMAKQEQAKFVSQLQARAK